MAVDIYISEDLVTEWNDVGDIRAVRDTDTDVEQIKQSIVISIIERGQNTVSSFTGTAIEQQRGEIEETIRANDTTEPPITVTVDEVNTEDRTITFVAETARVELPLTIS
jgi:hypothetical protein